MIYSVVLYDGKQWNVPVGEASLPVMFGTVEEARALLNVELATKQFSTGRIVDFNTGETVEEIGKGVIS